MPMADNTRKRSPNRENINTYVKGETKQFLFELADRGDLSYGWAIDELVRRYKALRSATKAQQPLEISGRIQ
jgi:hypothetical protein